MLFYSCKDTSFSKAATLIFVAFASSQVIGIIEFDYFY